MQSGFLKVLTCFIHLFEKLRKYLDTGGHGSALTDLPNSFNCIDHLLLIAKINAYGVDSNSLCFLASNLEKKKQETKVNGSYSNFDDICGGVPKVSKLGLLLFNIYIRDLLFGNRDLNIAAMMITIHHPLSF